MSRPANLRKRPEGTNVTDAAPLIVSRPPGTLTHGPEPVNRPQRSRNGPVMEFTRPASASDGFPKSGPGGRSNGPGCIAPGALPAPPTELRAQAGVQSQADEPLSQRGFVQRVNE